MPQQLDYLEPFWAAFRRMQALLFQPFDLTRWLAIGFTAWLALLGEGQGSFNVNLPSRPTNHQGMPSPWLGAFWREYFWIILAVGVLVILLVLAIGLLLLWLSARGRFMFLDNALKGRAEVAAPWREFRLQGRSLFLWLLVYGLLMLVALLLMAGVAVALAWPALRAKCFDVSAVAGLAVGLPLLTVLLVINGYVTAFLQDFIIPLMHKHRLPACAAWRLWLPLWRAQPGAFLLYGLLRFGVGLAAGFAVLLVACLTCCCCCGLLIPYINVVILLPVVVWERYWGPEFLRQFGPAYDAWLAVPPPLPT